jgi:dUTP pyrophosphatase
MKVKIKKIHPDAAIPSYAKNGDAGLDLVATTIIGETLGSITYGLGIALEIPEGFVGLIFPRSSIRKTGLQLSNSVGVVDSG